VTRLFFSILFLLTSVSTVHAEDKAEATKSDAEVDSKTDAKATVDGDEASENEEKKDKGPKHPVNGTVSIGHAFNHANFVDSEADFGYQSISGSFGIIYSPVKSLSLSSSLAVRKMVVPDYFNSGTPSRTTRTPWEISDVGVNARYSNFYQIPVVDIKLSGGLGVTFPATKAAQSAGLIAAFSPSLTAGWSHSGFRTSISGSYTYFLNENPTIQINCDNAPDNCIISGSDTAIPNALHNLSTRLSLGYGFLKKFNVGVSYGISVGFRAVEFPNDEFTSPLAQVGNQASLGRQSFGTSFSYSPLPGSTIALSMATLGSLYTNDNKSYRFPLFDTESQLHHRTRYSLTLTQMF